MVNKRGKCTSCGKRTRHHKKTGEWFCVHCEQKLLNDLGLEDEVNKPGKDDEQIIKVVNRAGLNARELQILLKQPQKSKVSERTYNHSRGKRTHIRIGILADTHIGHEKFDEALLASAGETFKALGIQDVYHAGDITEGMSGRPGHIYELKQIGFTQQVGEVERLFKKYLKGFNIFGITGNHDQWYTKGNNAGIDVGTELANRVPNFTYLGENEADIKLAPNVIMKLFHPGDGTAYATSYKMQKLMESLEGGRKPNIIVEGHYHKALYMFNRNIHGIEGGTICGQTGWMRGKKIPAHKGFWVLDMDVNAKGITRFTPSFYPAYD